jgi:hypothetical protein
VNFSGDGHRLSAVSVEKTCACPFSIAREYAELYLKGAETGGPEAIVSVPVPIPFLSLHRAVAMSYSVSADVTETGRGHDEVVLHWSTGARFLPDVRGAIRFRMAGLSTLVRIEGSYRPPFGRFGGAFDKIAGAWIAKRTFGDLLKRICRSLEAQQSEWLQRQELTPLLRADR